MKTVLVIPYNPLVEVGGLELGTIRLAKALESRGCSAKVLSLGRSGSFNGVTVSGSTSFPELCRSLVLRSEEYDILHWMEIFPDPGQVELQAMVSGLLRSLGKKVVWMVATSGNLKNRGSGELITPLICSTADTYIISNPDQIQEFADSGIIENVHMIGFGMDTVNEFHPVSAEEKLQLRRSLRLPLDKVLCLYIGRFVERKRPDFLLRAWRSLADLYGQTHLVVVGSGMDQDDSIESQVVELARHAEGASFRKITDNPARYYQACDLLLLPSEREGQPNVLMEMMSCGNPVIGSDIAGIRELLISERNGLIFKLDDSAEFTEAIRRLVTDSDLRKSMGTFSRDDIVSQKDTDIVARQYLQLYENLLKGGN